MMFGEDQILCDLSGLFVGFSTLDFGCLIFFRGSRFHRIGRGSNRASFYLDAVNFLGDYYSHLSDHISDVDFFGIIIARFLCYTKYWPNLQFDFDFFRFPVFQ